MHHSLARSHRGCQAHCCLQITKRNHLAWLIQGISPWELHFKDIPQLSETVSFWHPNFYRDASDTNCVIMIIHINKSFTRSPKLTLFVSVYFRHNEQITILVVDHISNVIPTARIKPDFHFSAKQK